MAVRHYVAVDLGASSGRVMLASLETETRQLTLEEIHRFSNPLRHWQGHHLWDLDELERQIRHGLETIDARGIHPVSIGIDSWGVDMVALDKQGNRLGLTYSYRDHRTDGQMAQVTAELGRERLYRQTGIQFLPFNTLYQLRALRQQEPDVWGQIAHLLMIPDYFHYRLTGQMACEYTNASTTQLLNLHSGDWDHGLLDYLGIPPNWLATPHQPGQTLGEWVAPSGRAVPVVSVATHDTASAVVATPLTDADSAYLSSGTWSLIGIESHTPLTGPAALAANLTNEGGIGGRYRVLKNIMGLWLLQRVCQEQQVTDLPALLEAAASQPGFVSLINPNDERLINPPSMSDALHELCREHDQPQPVGTVALVRCILDSLALSYRQGLLTLGALRGTPLRHLHVVGGGSRNHLLNQLCADVCQVPVLAGPVEASTLGNIGCQLIAQGDVASLEAFRRLLTDNIPLQPFIPRQDSDFADHWRRFQALCQINEELTV
ncbi:rhamnulokinase [Dickeya zeae]|uniref:rhamnulokinase n=1 Tax=Dickeya zeae TaxID=204042 RepID=UPI001F1768BE|nr:rhamnulokinase [Dickeya zeae]UJR63264.1 rhamnulokinase [Dickeya zeae]